MYVKSFYIIGGVISTLKHKKIIFIIIVISLLGILLHGAYKYITEGSILGGTIFAFSLILGNLINQITWEIRTEYRKKAKMKWDSKLHIKALKLLILYLYA